MMKIEFLKNNYIVIIIAIFLFLVFLCGAITDIRYSDEIFHFWFAKDWHSTGQRPVYNELVDTIPEIDYYRYYFSAPLWHYLLKCAFDVFGPSRILAQLYMTIWYGALVFGVYLLSKALYGKEAGLYSAFVAAATPFFVGFSVLFFIDMPIAVASTYLIFFLVKRRYLICAVIMGLMFLLKENSYLVFPSICLLMLFYIKKYSSLNIAKRICYITLFSIIVFSINVSNYRYKLDNFHGFLTPNGGGITISAALTVLRGDTQATAVPSHADLAGEEIQKEKEKEKEKEVKKINYLTSPLMSPKTLFQYFGLLLPCFFIYRIVNIIRKRDINLSELFLLVPAVVYIPFYLIAFRGWWEIRYLSPVIPLICVFAAKSVQYLKPNYRLLIIFIGCATFLGSLFFTYTKRQVNASEVETINYVKNLPDGRILTPEELFISYYTGKPTIWLSSFTLPDGKLEDFFWNDENNKKEQILTDYKIKFLLIPHHRNYDDSQTKHFGGYPQSFVEEIKSLPFFEKVYDNNYTSIWRVTL